MHGPLHPKSKRDKKELLIAARDGKNKFKTDENQIVEKKQENGKMKHMEGKGT